MGAERIVKIVVGLALVGLLVLLCLSGPYHEPDGTVKPLFGTVRVQLASGRYPADTRELTAVLQSGETEALSLFKNLVAADFSGSSCYEEIAAWARENPSVLVKYTVTLPDGSVYGSDTSTIELGSGPVGDIDALCRALKALPKLNQVKLGTVGEGAAISLSDAAALRSALPEVKFDFGLSLMGQSIAPDAETLDLSALTPEEVPDAAAVLSCLTNLKEIDLGSQDSSLNWEEIGLLAEACPDAKLNYRFSLYGQELSLDAESLDFNHTAIDDEGAAIRQILPLMKNCTYLDMDYCGVSNEAMAAIREENPNVEVVWRIWFGENYSVRTDTERILASKPTVGGMIYDGPQRRSQRPELRFHHAGAGGADYCHDQHQRPESSDQLPQAGVSGDSGDPGFRPEPPGQLHGLGPPEHLQPEKRDRRLPSLWAEQAGTAVGGHQHPHPRGAENGIEGKADRLRCEHRGGGSP